MKAAEQTDILRHRRMRRVFPVLMTGAAALLLLSIILAVSIGQVRIPFAECYRILAHRLFGLGSGETSQVYRVIVEDLRGPRVMLSAVVGAGLALCGTVMQASVQNPLADPYILGTSSGASLGATFVIMAGAGAGVFASFGVVAAAFIGAASASVLVLFLARISGRATSAKLVLAGVIVNMICSTFRDIIIYAFPKEEGMRTVSFWAMGSVAGTSWKTPLRLFFVVLLLAAFFWTQARNMNALLLGEETAVTLGVNAGAMQMLYLLLAALLTGVLVSQCGIIGYVGLVVPHFSRALVGADHRRLIPFSLCMGALLLLWCDVLARSLLGTSELPLGLVSSAIGAPMLLYMLIKSKMTG